MNIADAQNELPDLVARVHLEGITVDLEQDNKIVARLTPATPQSPLTVGQLEAFLNSLPPLGEDAEQFARDLKEIRAAFPS